MPVLTRSKQNICLLKLAFVFVINFQIDFWFMILFYVIGNNNVSSIDDDTSEMLQSINIILYK